MCGVRHDWVREVRGDWVKFWVRNDWVDALWGDWVREVRSDWVRGV